MGWPAALMSYPCPSRISWDQILHSDTGRNSQSRSSRQRPMGLAPPQQHPLEDIQSPACWPKSFYVSFFNAPPWGTPILRWKRWKSPQGGITFVSKRHKIDVMTPAQPHSLGFGGFLLSLDRLALTHFGQLVPLTPKALEVLRVLALAGGKIVSRNDLVDSVWGETIVEESNLTQTIFLLRQALRQFDVSDYIETVPRQGYMFRGDIRVFPGVAPEASIGQIKSRPNHRRLAAAAPIVLLSLAVAAGWRQIAATKPATKDPPVYNRYLRG